MIRAITLAALLLGAAAPAAAVNIIVNGDFETAGTSDTVPFGWTLNTGSNPLSLLRLDGNFYRPYGATGTTAELDNHFLAFGAYDSPNGTTSAPYEAPYLEQSFRTVAGQAYYLYSDFTAFGASHQGFGTYLMSEGTWVSFARNGSIPFTDLGRWAVRNFGPYMFYGTGGVMSIRFASEGNTTSSDLFIDNIRLETASAAVPEPATWAMMIAGFGLVGGAMRRRATVARA